VRAFPCTYAHFRDLALFGVQVVEVLIVKREFAHARGYARDVRRYLDQAEHVARREARFARRVRPIRRLRPLALKSQPMARA
jgi:hypothetical protein